MERKGLMSENAVPEPWEAVVMPTDCAGVASTSLGMVVPAPAWSPAVVMVAECVCGAFSAAMCEWFSLPPRSPTERARTLF